MEKWIKLKDFKGSCYSGTLFGFSAKYPFEDHVVMMLCDHCLGNQRFNLVTITGYKAGINPYVIFPNECVADDNGLNIQWLIKNWNKWVFPESNVDEVWVKSRLDAFEIMKL